MFWIGVLGRSHTCSFTKYIEALMREYLVKAM